MALVTMNFRSHLLDFNHEISIILPDRPKNLSGKDFYSKSAKYKVLWLLHGTYGDHTDWVRKSNIELYACEHNLAVVMMSGMNANYVNWPEFGTGYYLYDYFFEELMPMIYNWYPISDKRQDNYIAGLSMGGFGTMTLALNNPERFAAAASLSGPIINLKTMKKDYEDMELDLTRLEKMIKNAGGYKSWLDSVENTWDKLIELDGKNILPKLYFCIGDRDFLYPAYLKFKAFAQRRKMDISFEEASGYAHEWRFWDKYIEKIIKEVFAIPLANNKNSY